MRAQALCPFVLGIFAALVVACVEPNPAEDESSDDGEDIGGPICTDPQQGLLAFELSGGEPSETIFELPGEDWLASGVLGSGDFDGDGVTDLVVGGRVVFGPISVDSDYVELDIGDLSYQRALAVDLDDDGRDELLLGLLRELDFMPHARLFAVSAAREVETLELPSWYDESSSGYPALAAGDVSGDGLPDLVLGGPNFSLADESGQLAVLVGDGARGFAGELEIIDYVAPNSATHAVSSLTLTQLDGVGGLDILSTHTITSYSGPRPENFVLETTSITSSPQFEQFDLGPLHDATFADFNQDGRTDVVHWDGQHFYLSLAGDAGFDPAVLAFDATIHSYPTMIVADLDGDALLELVVATREQGSTIAIAQGQAGGTLAEPVFAESPGFEGTLVGGSVGDIDDDGSLEVFALGRWCGVDPS